MLGKFQRLSRRGKPLYMEAYKIMAASEQVIKAQLKIKEEVPATPFLTCLHDMISQQLTLAKKGSTSVSLEALFYCFSSIISIVDLGVIANQQQKILDVCS